LSSILPEPQVHWSYLVFSTGLVVTSFESVTFSAGQDTRALIEPLVNTYIAQLNTMAISSGSSYRHVYHSLKQDKSAYVMTLMLILERANVKVRLTPISLCGGLIGLGAVLLYRFCRTSWSNQYPHQMVGGYPTAPPR